MHRRRARLILSALGVTAALALVCCSSAEGEQPDHRAAVVGDSITFLSSPEIQTVLGEAGYDATVVGRIGKTAAEVRADVDAARSTEPRVVLFELGTNDATRSATNDGSASAFEEAMSQYLAEFPHACLIATTVTEHRPSTVMNDTAAAINAWIETHFTHVVDWDAYEWAKRESGVALTVDDVHPNELGKAQLAQLDLAAVQQCGSATGP